MYYASELRESALAICYKDIVSISASPSPDDIAKSVLAYILSLFGMKSSWDVAKTSLFKVRKN